MCQCHMAIPATRNPQLVAQGPMRGRSEIDTTIISIFDYMSNERSRNSREGPNALAGREDVAVDDLEQAELSRQACGALSKHRVA